MAIYFWSTLEAICKILDGTYNWVVKQIGKKFETFSKLKKVDQNSPKMTFFCRFGGLAIFTEASAELFRPNFTEASAEASGSVVH